MKQLLLSCAGVFVTLLLLVGGCDGNNRGEPNPAADVNTVVARQYPCYGGDTKPSWLHKITSRENVLNAYGFTTGFYLLDCNDQPICDINVPYVLSKTSFSNSLLGTHEATTTPVQDITWTVLNCTQSNSRADTTKPFELLNGLSRSITTLGLGKWPLDPAGDGIALPYLYDHNQTFKIKFPTPSPSFTIYANAHWYRPAAYRLLSWLEWLTLSDLIYPPHPHLVISSAPSDSPIHFPPEMLADPNFAPNGWFIATKVYNTERVDINTLNSVRIDPSIKLKAGSTTRTSSIPLYLRSGPIRINTDYQKVKTIDPNNFETGDPLAGYFLPWTIDDLNDIYSSIGFYCTYSFYKPAETQDVNFLTPKFQKYGTTLMCHTIDVNSNPKDYYKIHVFPVYQGEDETGKWVGVYEETIIPTWTRAASGLYPPRDTNEPPWNAKLLIGISKHEKISTSYFIPDNVALGLQDLARLSLTWLSAPDNDTTPFDMAYDFNKDGTINLVDFAYLAAKMSTN